MAWQPCTPDCGGRPANGEEQLLPPFELDPPSYARAELPAVSVDGAGVSPHWFLANVQLLDVGLVANCC